MTEDANKDAINALAAVSVKLPAFWRVRPATWFTQVEASSRIKGITTDDTKYRYIVQSLDADIALQVADYLDEPPQQNKYEGLKERLVDAFGLDAEDGASAILDAGPLGADSPSKRMAELLAMFPKGEKPGALFKEVFLRQLPPHIPPLLKNKEFDNLRSLAKAADKLMQPFGSQIDSVRRPTPKPRSFSSRPVTAQRTSRPEGVNPSICDFHAKFGSAARNCRPPCLFTSPSENFTAGRQ
jgi:hypothetical protein